jgi:hypothetical protein
VTACTGGDDAQQRREQGNEPRSVSNCRAGVDQARRVQQALDDTQRRRDTQRELLVVVARRMERTEGGAFSQYAW